MDVDLLPADQLLHQVPVAVVIEAVGELGAEVLGVGVVEERPVGTEAALLGVDDERPVARIVVTVATRQVLEGQGGVDRSEAGGGLTETVPIVIAVVRRAVRVGATVGSALLREGLSSDIHTVDANAASAELTLGAVVREVIVNDALAREGQASAVLAAVLADLRGLDGVGTGPSVALGREHLAGVAVAGRGGDVLAVTGVDALGRIVGILALTALAADLAVFAGVGIEVVVELAVTVVVDEVAELRRARVNGRVAFATHAVGAVLAGLAEAVAIGVFDAGLATVLFVGDAVAVTVVVTGVAELVVVGVGLVVVGDVDAVVVDVGDLVAIEVRVADVAEAVLVLVHLIAQVLRTVRNEGAVVLTVEDLVVVVVVITLVPQTVLVGIGLIGVRVQGAVVIAVLHIVVVVIRVTGVALPVLVVVGLVLVGDLAAVVLVVEDAVAVGVVFAGVTDAVVVAVRLIGVGHEGTVVDAVGHVVAVVVVVASVPQTIPIGVELVGVVGRPPVTVGERRAVLGDIGPRAVVATGRARLGVLVGHLVARHVVGVAVADAIVVIVIVTGVAASVEIHVSLDDAALSDAEDPDRRAHELRVAGLGRVDVGAVDVGDAVLAEVKEVVRVAVGRRGTVVELVGKAVGREALLDLAFVGGTVVGLQLEAGTVAADQTAGEGDDGGQHGQDGQSALHEGTSVGARVVDGSIVVVRVSHLVKLPVQVGV